MKLISIIAALAACLLLAYLLQEDLYGFIAFAVAGVLGGWFAANMPPGSERVYWLFVLLTLILFITGAFVFSLPGLVVIWPLVLVAGYFVARLTGRLTGQRRSLPS